MKKFYKLDTLLVRKNGEIMWRYSDVYKTTIRPPWYKFWKSTEYDFTFENVRYYDIPEIKE